MFKLRALVGRFVTKYEQSGIRPKTFRRVSDVRISDDRYRRPHTIRVQRESFAPPMAVSPREQRECVVTAPPGGGGIRNEISFR